MSCRMGKRPPTDGVERLSKHRPEATPCEDKSAKKTDPLAQEMKADPKIVLVGSMKSRPVRTSGSD
jgi:hypothetical protein